MRKNLILALLCFVFVPVYSFGDQYNEGKKTNDQDQLRVMVIGAHPDDAEAAGGLAAKYIQQGAEVQLVSVTNGDKGHHEIGEEKLAQIRREEAKAAGEVIGAEYVVMDNHDGELVPSLENRREIIRLIRKFNPDIIFTHAPNDYHPDHRYTSILVRDATYMVMVPKVTPEVEPMNANPVVFYISEGEEADVAIGIDEVVDKKVAMYHAHKSQMYEWLPWIGNYQDKVPEGEEARKEWIKKLRSQSWINTADNFRDVLTEIYGKEKAQEFKYAEAYRKAPYGGEYEEDQLYHYFPFLKENAQK